MELIFFGGWILNLYIKLVSNCQQNMPKLLSLPRFKSNDGINNYNLKQDDALDSTLERIRVRRNTWAIKFFRALRLILLLLFVVLLILWATGSGFWSANVFDSSQSATTVTSNVKVKIETISPTAPMNTLDPQVKMNSFKFCDPLINATFNFPLLTSNDLIQNTTNEIDSNAERIYNKAKFQNVDYDDATLLRFACFTSAKKEHNTKLMEEVTIKSLAPLYFPFLSIGESAAVKSVRHRLEINATCNYKRHYKIAYVLMAHDHGLEEIKNIYSLLHEDDAFFYFHIDAKEPLFRKKVKDWIRTDLIIRSRCNAAFIPNPTSIVWGHATMVFAQLELFFQLYHLIDFDYIINLSIEHYPIKSTNAMYLTLQVQFD